MFSLSGIITAGGTVEPIDNVRGITNFATGRLGSLIADRLAQDGHSVLYIHGRNADSPENPRVDAYEIGSVHELRDKLHALFAVNRVDVIIHSMAVSDYTVERVTDAGGQVLSGGKIGSEYDELILHLRQTPKIISEFQFLAPQAALIGFKLLSGASKVELMIKARELLTKNNCAYVLANLLEDISGDRHMAYLLDKTGEIAEYQTKQEIAEGMALLCQKIFCSA
jgi:phosphopantothenate-cysteine ligase